MTRIACTDCDKQFGGIKNMRQDNVTGQIYCITCWAKYLKRVG